MRFVAAEPVLSECVHRNDAITDLAPRPNVKCKWRSLTRKMLVATPGLAVAGRSVCRRGLGRTRPLQRQWCSRWICRWRLRRRRSRRLRIRRPGSGRSRLLGGGFVGCSVALDGGKRHLRLEGRSVVPTRSSLHGRSHHWRSNAIQRQGPRRCQSCESIGRSFNRSATKRRRKPVSGSSR